jgi:hypothetical protein
VAAGDFDGDGFDDLAVSAPGEDVPGAPTAGAITVFSGSATGLAEAGSRQMQADSTAVAGRAEAGDRLGVALAAGDTDGDGIGDLAIGIPGQNLPGANDAGAVLVLPGGPDGLRGAGSVELHGDSPGVAGDGREGDHLGISVVLGDLTGDGRADLAAGAPDKDTQGRADAGAVLVLHGSGEGIRARGSSQFNGPAPRAGDHLGAAVAIGDELVAGAPGRAVGGRHNSGAVAIRGLGFVHGDSPGIEGAAEVGDRFGASLAAGDLDGDEHRDVVVGMPDEDLAGIVDAGATQHLHGPDLGPSPIFHADSAGVPGTAERGDRWSGVVPSYLD